MASDKLNNKLSVQACKLVLHFFLQAHEGHGNFTLNNKSLILNEFNNFIIHTRERWIYFCTLALLVRIQNKINFRYETCCLFGKHFIGIDNVFAREFMETRRCMQLFVDKENGFEICNLLKKGSSVVRSSQPSSVVKSIMSTPKRTASMKHELLCIRASHRSALQRKEPRKP